MSELITRRRTAIPILALVGSLSLAGCSSPDTGANRPPHGGQQLPNVPPLAVPGQVLHCTTTGQSKSLPEANFTSSEERQIGSVFKVTTPELVKYSRAFLSTCDASLTGGIVTRYGEIPEMKGDPSAAGKECVIWKALYPDRQLAQADAPVNTFVVVCDSQLPEVRRSASPTTIPTHTAQA